MTSQAKEQSLESLLEALSGVRHAISQSNEARFIVASPTLAGLKRQHLPDHIRVSVKKRQGPRVRVRGSRSAKLQQFLLARWPRDHLIETSLPSMACVEYQRLRATLPTGRYRLLSGWSGGGRWLACAF